jgi:hypothetical protein
VATVSLLRSAANPFKLQALAEDEARNEIGRLAKRKAIIWPSVVVDGWLKSDRINGREFVVRGEAWTT